MAKEIKPQDTTRATAYELWMKAPNPMVTVFKTMDVTNLVRCSKKKHLKFNMLLDYCIGMAASSDDMQIRMLYPEGNAEARFKIRGVRGFGQYNG